MRLRITLLPILVLLNSCRTNSNQEQIDVKESKITLEGIVNSNITDDNITPGTALTSILDFYKNYKTDTGSENADDDMLLFQYGTYDWDGSGGKFEFNLTRQIADPDDEEFYQVKLTLYYKATDIGEIESFNLWSIDKPTIDDWQKAIKDTEGFKRAIKARPFDYKVELTKT
ncbi:MAG: hypothetical protein J0L67_03040 [Cytophagales bacterium]|nr:hypothetical protein [Cytophagales bacterium]